MTDSAPLVSVPPRTRGILSRRRALWLLAAVAIGACAGYGIYLRSTERAQALAAITAAGGQFRVAPEPQRLARNLLRLFGRSDRGGDLIFLDGPKFDDAWLAAHHDLRSLEINDLTIRDTRLSRQAVMRLLQQNNLGHFMADGVPFTDADAEIIGQKNHLLFLSLAQSELTNAGLEHLQPLRLLWLNVAGTGVTSDGLRKALAGDKTLLFLTFDGRQFTPELAEQLASKSLTTIRLIGPDVTDSHIKLLASMQNVKCFRIEQTNVSEAAIAALRAARPTPVIVEVPDPDDIFYRWRTE